MDDLSKNFTLQDFKLDPKQIEQLRQQMEEMRALRFGDYV
jgi:hypothetical protein